MLKRGGKNSYNPYSTSQRVKKAESKGKDRLDILPNKHNVWLKQVRLLCTHKSLNRKYALMLFFWFPVKYLKFSGCFCLVEMHLSSPKSTGR